MDYKKIIKSRNVRLAILNAFGFIPDKMMIQMQYRIKTGRKLNLKNPQRYTEKLQWYKLYYRDPLMVQCADKYDVREYVQSKGLGDILTKCYGVYERVEDIDFDSLPDQFVMKDTLGGGGNSVIIVKDKASFDMAAAKEQIRKWVNAPAHVRSGGREWPYYSGKNHRIIIEEYIPSDTNEGGLIDYKFFCFSGEPQIVYVIADRQIGQSASLGVFTADYQKINVVRCDEKPLDREIPKPVVYNRMLNISRKLSAPFPGARIDLYCEGNQIFFGEITFFDGSGYMCFKPDNFDFELGKFFELPTK